MRWLNSCQISEQGCVLVQEERNTIEELCFKLFLYKLCMWRWAKLMHTGRLLNKLLFSVWRVKDERNLCEFLVVKSLVQTNPDYANSCMNSWYDNPIANKPWLTSKSDKHLISQKSISPESHINVMRIKEIIADSRSFWLLG